MKLFKRLMALSLAVLLAFAIVGCGKGGKDKNNAKHYEDNGEYYEIKYYLPITTDGISQTFPDMEDIEDAINEIIYPKINARIILSEILYFNYSEQMTNRIASAEEFDLCWTSPTINYYWTNIKRRAFLPLNTLLDDFAPHVKEQVPAYAWEQATYTDGSIYGVVNQQIIPRTDAVVVNSYDLFNEFLSTQGYEGYTYENIYEYIVEQEIHSNEIIEEYVRWLKRENKGLGGKLGALDVQDGLQNRYHWENLGTGMLVPGVVDCEDSASDGMTVFNQFATDEFKADIQRQAANYKSGLAPKTITTGDKGTSPEAYDVCSLTTWKPNDIRIYSDGTRGGAVRLGNPYYYTSYILGSMTAISSTSKNPARVMKFLDLLWTDAELNNLLCFGIEGEHYTKTEGEDGLKISMKKNSGYDNSSMTWAYSSEFIDGLYYLDRYETNPYVKSKKINDEAHLNDAVGFVFDESPVTAKISSCKAIAITYLTEFSTGQHGDNVMAKYDEFMDKMSKAGMNDIIAEKQKQLNAWLASK